MTARTVAVNSTWAHISDDRSMRIKQNTSSLEKEAVVDITFASTDTYTTGGLTIDFSVIRNFKTVYFCDIIYNGYVLPIQYVASATNDAKTGKLKAFDSTGAELGAGSAVLESVKLTVVIRGY